MRARTVLVAFSASIGLLGFGLARPGVDEPKPPSRSTHSAGPGKTPETRIGAGEPRAEAGVPAGPTRPGVVAGGPRPPDDAIFPVSVKWSLDLDPEAMRSYQRAARIIQGVTTAPASRKNYYAGVASHRHLAITGWWGVICDLRRDPDGTRFATVAVGPSLKPMSILDNPGYYEQFVIDPDDSVRFVGSLDPGNAAGQVFRIAGGL